MKLILKIKFDDGQTIEIPEDKAEELYFKLKRLYDQPIWVDPYPANPYPVIPWYGSDAPWTPSYPIITCGA